MMNVPELDRCVHCGLCLNHCPTYRALQLEPESPRGRIHLVRALAEGRIQANERLAEHLYLCLMCRACESACPSGVRYGRIAEAGRAAVGPPGPPLARSLAKLAFTQLLPFPQRLRFLARLLRFYQRSGAQRAARSLLPQGLRELAELLPPLPDRFFIPETEVLPAIGTRRARVGMLTGCVMSLFFADINRATASVLRRNGCEVVLPRDQVCCGALNVHNGETMAAKAMARRNIDAFLSCGAELVVVNAAGCGAAMKEYGHLLRDEPHYADKAARLAGMVRDVSEFLVALGPTAPQNRIEMTVTYQDPCHLAHGQRVRAEPRALLAALPGLRLIEMEEPDRCCGSAGIYNLTQPQMAQRILKEKMAAIAATGADGVVAPNPGCMLQIGYGARRYGPPLSVFHLIELLDRSYGGEAKILT